MQICKKKLLTVFRREVYQVTDNGGLSRLSKGQQSCKTDLSEINPCMWLYKGNPRPVSPHISGSSRGCNSSLQMQSHSSVFLPLDGLTINSVLIVPVQFPRTVNGVSSARENI